jgi:hypothetical protein
MGISSTSQPISAPCNECVEGPNKTRMGNHKGKVRIFRNAVAKDAAVNIASSSNRTLAA